jgi:hypothetical protein
VLLLPALQEDNDVAKQQPLFSNQSKTLLQKGQNGPNVRLLTSGRDRQNSQKSDFLPWTQVIDVALQYITAALQNTLSKASLRRQAIHNLR